MPFRVYYCVLALCSYLSLCFGSCNAELVAARHHAKLLESGKEVDEVGAGQVLKILRRDGTKLLVSRGRPGWIHANDVVPLGHAEEFFNQPFTNGASSRDYLARGTVLIGLGRHADGISDLKKAVEIASEPGEYLEPLAYAQMAANDQTDAIKTFSQAIEDEPDSTSALMGRGLAYYQVGQNQNAYVDLAKAIKSKPNHAFPRKYVGALLHDLGKTELAKTQLLAAAKIDPYDVFTRKSLGRLLFDLGNYANALKQFDIAVQLDAQDADAIAGRGVVAHAMGDDLKSARADFANAIRMSGETKEEAYLWSNLGQVQMEMGQSSDSLTSLRKALELDPEFVEAHSHRAYLLVTEFNSSASIKLAMSDMRAVFAMESERTYWDYRALAAVNSAREDYKRAEWYQSTAVKLLRSTGPKRFLEEAEIQLKTIQAKMSSSIQ